MSERHLIGGHFYPLAVRLALDSARGSDYARACAARALGEPRSARNEQSARARRSRVPASRAARAMPP